MATTTAQQLADIDRELRKRCRGHEPRKMAKRILTLLNERDRLLGVWTRTCVACGDSFNASRADAQYCSARCKQAAYRDRALRMRVTASSEIRPACGVPVSNGQSGGSTAAAAARAKETAR